MKKPIIGITMGDPAGNGSEISVKALSRPEIYEQCRPDYSVIQQLCAVLHVSLVELLDGRNGIKGYDEQTMIALLHRTQELEKQKIILYGLVLIVLGIAGGALANTTGGSDIQSFVSGLLMKLICCRNSFWYFYERKTGFILELLRNLQIGPKYRTFAAITGLHLYNWYRTNRFCGCCGHKTVHSSTERALKCPSCGHLIYPRIVPAVIVGVKNGDKILLTKYRKGFTPFALIAGFTEIGETLEETVAREVMEEAGIRVKNIQYYKSQPWGVVDDLLAGFYCEVDGDTEIHMDASELKLAEWKSRDEIELQPNDFSLTNEMMRAFKEGKF